MRIACLVIGLFLYVTTVCDGHLLQKTSDVAGIDIDLSKYGLDSKHELCNEPEIFRCECSAKKIPVSVAVPACNYGHLIPICKPCGDLKPGDICPRYSLCEQCKPNGGDSCATCPEGTFGTWCENNCTCHNGGTCERNGRCICPPSYEGRNCETRKVCGRSDAPRSPSIINGNATDIGQWPWQGYIADMVDNTWSLLCGASLLNEEWVITAAHCLEDPITKLRREPDEFQVYLGKYHRNDSKDDEYVQVRKIQNIIIHYDYNPVTYDADIALIQLDSPVELTSRVQPICLPTEKTTRENLVEGKQGMVTTWGMNENKTYSETLQQAAFSVVSKANCEKGFEKSGLSLTITDNMFCADYKLGQVDHCSFSGGSPMVFIDESSKSWVLEGIVSWTSSRECAMANEYGAYTRISRFLDWIKGNSVEVLHSKIR